MPFHPAKIEFRFEVKIDGRQSVTLGHELEATVVGKDWEVHDPAGIRREVGRAEFLDGAILDYLRRVLCGDLPRSGPGE